MITVLFLCLGNICRSPMAEAIFKDLVAKEGLSDHFYIDSVGTANYHVGEPAHYGTRRVLAEHGIACESISRQLNRDDLVRSDYIIAMDRDNVANLRRLGQAAEGYVGLLLDFAPDTTLKDVPDPYYTDNFEEVYHLVKSGCEGLLAYIRAERGI